MKLVRVKDLTFSNSVRSEVDMPIDNPNQFVSSNLIISSPGFTSFGSGLTLLSVLGKMLRLVEEDADFSRFVHFQPPSWYHK